MDEGALERSVKSAERVVILLDALAHSPPGLSFSDLLISTDIPKSSLHGLLKTLLRRRIVAFDERSKTYMIGTKLWELAMAYTRQLQIVPLAWPDIEELSQKVGETVQMGVLDGADIVYIAKAESRHPLQMVSHVGSRLPAYATAIGKALLAGLST
ncbi:transcriptional regulator, IclR family, partial [mine drainage metagenome]